MRRRTTTRNVHVLMLIDAVSDFDFLIESNFNYWNGMGWIWKGIQDDEKKKEYACVLEQQLPPTSHHITRVRTLGRVANVSNIDDDDYKRYTVG